MNRIEGPPRKGAHSENRIFESFVASLNNSHLLGNEEYLYWLNIYQQVLSVKRSDRKQNRINAAKKRIMRKICEDNLKSICSHGFVISKNGVTITSVANSN